MVSSAEADALFRRKYDEVHYEGRAVPLAHPDHMATVATVCGLSPPPPRTARVLELGCGVGMNLIALAQAMPEARFLGVDLVVPQIEYGRGIISRLGLRNIELRAQSIADVSLDDGCFDYIVAHGVFSWVPQPVRQKILAICGEQLSAHGIAYISYNTLPGRLAFHACRDLMLHHAKRYETLPEKTRHGREILEFLVASINPSGPYAAAMREEIDLVRQAPDHYLAYEHLHDENRSFYFREFMDLAGAAGLQFLSESEVRSSTVPSRGARIADALRAWGRNAVDIEQYIDFLRNVNFRETLLCRQGLTVDRRTEPERIRGLHVAASLQPRPGQTVQLDNAVVSFANAQNFGLITSHPPTKASIGILRECWPASVLLEDLQTAACLAAGVPAETHVTTPSLEPTPIDRHLAEDLLNGYLSGTVCLFIAPDSFTMHPSDRPIACPLARLMAEFSKLVINRRHENIRVPDSLRQWLVLLDGSRTWRDLAMQAPPGGGDVPPGPEAGIAIFARHALLVA